MSLNTLSELTGKRGKVLVHVDAIDEDVYMLNLNATERKVLIRRINDTTRKIKEIVEENADDETAGDAKLDEIKNLDAVTVSMSLCDDKGNLLCTTDEAIDELMSMDNVALIQLSKHVIKVNKIYDINEDFAEAKKP